MDSRRWSIIGFAGLLLAALVATIAVVNLPAASRPSGFWTTAEPVAAPNSVAPVSLNEAPRAIAVETTASPVPIGEASKLPEVQAGSLRGQVMDQSRRPLADVVVLLLDGAFRQEALTDALGEYRFGHAHAGTCRVEPLLPDTLRYQSGPGELHVSAGKETRAAPIVLSTLVSLSVRLLDAAGNPTLGRDRAGRRLHVVAVFSSPRARQERIEAVVDDAGVATFAAVPADAFEFALNVIGYRATGDLPLRLLDDRANDAGDVRLFELETLETDPAPLLGGLAGRVVNESNRPLAKVTIVAHRVADKDSYGRTHRSDERVITGADGKFSFDVLPVGRWYLNIMDRQWAVVSEVPETEVVQGEVAAVADIVLRPAVGLRVRLLDQDGNPVQGYVTAGFTCEESKQTHVAECDDKGFVVFVHAPETATDMRLSVTGYEVTAALPVRPVKDSLVDAGTVTLTRKPSESKTD